MGAGLQGIQQSRGLMRLQEWGGTGAGARGSCAEKLGAGDGAAERQERTRKVGGGKPGRQRHTGDSPLGRPPGSGTWGLRWTLAPQGLLAALLGQFG